MGSGCSTSESERRVFGVSVWRETPFFTDRERAALAWTEAVTLLPQTHAPDADYQELRKNFSEREQGGPDARDWTHQHVEPARRGLPQVAHRLKISLHFLKGPP